MKRFILERYSCLPQKDIFQISTDVVHFPLVMPNYFKSIKIIKENKNTKILLEKIRFLGISINVKTKHIIKEPNIHEIYLLSGPLKGTTFIESYISVGLGTSIIIDVKLKFPRLMKFFFFLENYIARKMSKITDEFISSAEKFHLSSVDCN